MTTNDGGPAVDAEISKLATAISNCAAGYAKENASHISRAAADAIASLVGKGQASMSFRDTVAKELFVEFAAGKHHNGLSHGVLAKLAYDAADAMLAAREASK